MQVSCRWISERKREKEKKKESFYKALGVVFHFNFSNNTYQPNLNKKYTTRAVPTTYRQVQQHIMSEKKKTRKMHIKLCCNTWIVNIKKTILRTGQQFGLFIEHWVHYQTVERRVCVSVRTKESRISRNSMTNATRRQGRGVATSARASGRPSIFGRSIAFRLFQFTFFGTLTSILYNTHW